MSIVGSRTMGTPFFGELKKQASFFLKEKIRTARLALTDVTPAQLLTEEATNGNSWAPDAKTMGVISRAAFEIDDYWRIVEILHNRLSSYDRKNWRGAYQALILLEHLLTHGPESIAEEFQSDTEIILQIGTFQHIDERGFNWGLTVRKKSERVLKLLQRGPLLKEERDRARKISRGIQGFGSFSVTSSSTNRFGIEQASNHYGRSLSRYEDYSGREGLIPDHQNEDSNANTELGGRRFTEEKSSDESLPIKEDAGIVLKGSLPAEESKPLFAGKDGPKIEFREEVQHPFINLEHQTRESLLLLSHS